jgi:mRNA-degrading endonuclease toxin of MazEF toxin-antitoxin module
VSQSGWRIERGTLCWATLPAGVGHDQGTRRWLVISQLAVQPRPPRAIVLPISGEQPPYGYPLSWQAPANWDLPQPSWVLIDHIRSAPSVRLRDPFGQAQRTELDEVLAGLQQLLGLERWPM